VTSAAPANRRPVVLLAEELAPSVVAVLGDGVEVRSVDGADRAALLPALADADAVIIRSATQVDAEALAAAPRLKVVARAGIGLDNVDVPAATARGVMVVNAPQSNIVSAAEQAVALLLACARNLGPANASLKAGRWERSRFTGVEVADKVVGVVGLGRIGVLFAQRMSAFGTTLIAYDPYVAPARAAQIGVRLVSLEELLRESDFISIHLPKTPETIGLIGAEQLALCKPTVRIVNAARGGLLDEQALAEALAAGTVAGAGLDVYATEPCTDSPLFAFDSVVVAPHLGASTVEAQDKAGIAVARSVRLALEGDFVPDAVNVQAGGTVPEELRPALPLVEKLGRVFTALAGGVAASLEVEVRGEVASLDVSVLQLAASRASSRTSSRSRSPSSTRPRSPPSGALRSRSSRAPTARSTATSCASMGCSRPARWSRSPALSPGRARSRSSSRSTASTWSCSPRATCCSSAITTSPAWSVRSAPTSATPASTSPARRSAAPPRAATRSWR